MSNQKLFKIVGLVGLITIISKIFGLLRDLVIAKFYGTSITADAYNFAYLLTGNFLILLGGLGGPFHSATITTLTKIKDNAKESGSFLIKILTSTFIVLFFLTLLILKFKTNIVHLIVPATGLDPSYKEKLWYLTGLQLEIMSPLIIISGLLGIFCGVSNTYGKYFWPSFSPVLPSIAIILFVLYYNNPAIGIALGIGTLIGAVLQLLVQLPDLFKAGVYENLKFELVKNQKVVSDFYHFLGPAILSTTIGQVTVYIDSFFCSGLQEGSWTATVFANRLIQLPLGVLLTSFLVPFFPRFSELAHSHNIAKLKETSIVVIKSLWFLTLPIAVYLFLFSKPIVEIIFERGAFDERSTMLTSSILIALLLSMIAYVARDTLTRVFYSLGDSRIPLLVAICSIILKIFLNALLVKKYQAPGIAFATSLITLFNFLLLGVLLRKKIGCLGWTRHLRSLIKISTVTLVMYLFGFLFLSVFPLHLEKYDFFSKLILISTSLGTCFLLYFGLALTLRIEEAIKIFKEIRKKFMQSQ
ncbi:MAG: murein biosynthesis integral membrane protein MurJ [Candidatus Melainabacteria bacterium]|nr:murein biosynthesis integral membrane protein MurJ [Candidatus Melainabacteria bacterium]